jgi:hypothetical protein
MADRTWHKAFLLAAVGVALAAGCTINETSDDDDGGESGSGGSSSGAGGKGGSSGSGGSAGKGGTSGASGSGGSAGSTGGSAGTAGSAGSGGTAGSTAGSSGTAGTGGTGMLEDDDPICDPPSGMLDSTPYDTCEPAEGEEEDACALCIEESCCDESKACYGYAPGNVCGWGGPIEGGEYVGGGEIGCYRSCILDFVEGDGDGAYDETTEGECVAACTTVTDASGMECDGNIGTVTSEMIGCMKTSCDEECFLTP